MLLVRITVYMQKKYVRRIGGIGSVFLLVLLASCGGPNPVNVASPTPTLPRISWITFDLHLPLEALNAPVVGPLSNGTVLHVSITFHVNQQVLNTLQATPVKSWLSQGWIATAYLQDQVLPLNQARKRSGELPSLIVTCAKMS